MDMLSRFKAQSKICALIFSGHIIEEFFYEEVNSY
jgi:hypothetical protein